MATTLTQAQLIYLINIKLTSGVLPQLDVLNNKLNVLNTRLNQTKKSSQSAGAGLMGFGLSVLFGGMAVKMLATNILTSLVTAFVTARDEGDFLVNRLLAMQASLEFLKFAIFDAFAQSDLFMQMTEAIINMVNGISMFVSQNPRLAQFIVFMLLALVVIGAFGMVLGQAALIAIGLQISLFAVVAIVLILAIVAGILFAIWTGDGTLAEKIFWTIVVVVLALVIAVAILNVSLLPIFLIIGLIAIAVAALWAIWQADMNPVMKMLLAFVALLVIILSVAGLLGVAISAPFLVVAGVIVVIIFALQALSEKVGGLGNAFKAVGIFILRILATVVDVIVNGIILAINGVITLINYAIAAYNRFTGGNVNLIETIDLLNLGGKVDQMRDNLIAEGQAGKTTTASASNSNSTTNVFQIDNAYGDDVKLERGITDILKKYSDESLGSVNRG